MFTLRTRKRGYITAAVPSLIMTYYNKIIKGKTEYHVFGEKNV